MDIQILYPNQQFIHEHDEKHEPEIYNYICVHGKQLFIRKIKKNYQVLTAKWLPISVKDKDQYKLTDRFHILYSNPDIFNALVMFKLYAKELYEYIDYSYQTTNYVQKELFNVLRSSIDNKC